MFQRRSGREKTGTGRGSGDGDGDGGTKGEYHSKKKPVSPSLPSFILRTMNKHSNFIAIVVVLVVLVIFAISEIHFTSSDPTASIPHSDIVPVFYNVYAKADRISPTTSIIKEQMAQLRPEHKVFVRSIGVPVEIENTTTIRFDEEGDEVETLGLLWQHCRDHTSDKVVYIHSKGSFHPSSANDRLRRFLTRGALSEECLNLPSSCNTCSSRMSPLPHPHTAGNMWLARCEYVQKLINPLEFDLRMARTAHAEKYVSVPWCVGLGRFAAEHWIHSHPSNMPCDLSPDDYIWGYSRVPRGNFEMKLEPAPRFEINKYVKKRHSCFFQETKLIGPRLKEYKSLYPNETVPEAWWGWKFYDNETTKE